MALSDQQAYALNNKKNNKKNEDNNNNNNNDPEDIPIVEIEEEPHKEPNPERQHMQELILETREKILELIERDPSKYNPDDVELARTDDWQVERFLKKKKNNVDDAVKMIDDTMQWRHQLDMPNRKDEEFPIEFLKVGAIFGYEPDREGNGVVYMRVRMHRRINEIDQIERLFILHTINKMDKQTNGKGMVIVFDCKGVGVSNIDMEMMLFLINSLIKYYPDGLRNILVYEMPWLLTQTWRIIHNLLPAEYRNKIKMVDKKSILNHIDSANLPLYIGGQCLRNYHHVPEGCRTAEECGRDIGLTEKQIQRIFQLFRPFLEEAEEETKLLVERTEALNHINNNNDVAA